MIMKRMPILLFLALNGEEQFFALSYLSNDFGEIDRAQVKQNPCRFRTSQNT
jgi:hypothetical protein